MSLTNMAKTVGIGGTKPYVVLIPHTAWLNATITRTDKAITNIVLTQSGDVGNYVEGWKPGNSGAVVTLEQREGNKDAYRYVVPMRFFETTSAGRLNLEELVSNAYVALCKKTDGTYEVVGEEVGLRKMPGEIVNFSDISLGNTFAAEIGTHPEYPAEPSVLSYLDAGSEAATQVVIDALLQAIA